MAQFRRLIGLAVFLLLIAAAYWAWNAYPELGGLELLRPWRGELATWRIPLLAIAAFFVLSVLQWLVERFDKIGH